MWNIKKNKKKQRYTDCRVFIGYSMSIKEQNEKRLLNQFKVQLEIHQWDFENINE